MFHIYSFHFGIIIFEFYPEVVKWSSIYKKMLYRGLFLYTASNFINEETPTQCFPKLFYMIIFAKNSIVDVWLGYKYASVLPLHLKHSYKDFLL